MPESQLMREKGMEHAVNIQGCMFKGLCVQVKGKT